MLTEEARMLDLQDRYLNAHSSKYLIKAGRIEDAIARMALFSKDQDTHKLNVHEMQTMWYENHAGYAFLAKNKYREALKQFSYIPLHFQQMLEDCNDF